MIALLAILSLVLMIMPAQARNNPLMPDKFSLHQVKRGDSLWKISRTYIPETDPRIGIQWIREINGLGNTSLIRPGDLLNIPDPAGKLTEPLGPDYKSVAAAANASRVAFGLLPASRAGPPQRELIMTATAYTAGYESTGKRPGEAAYGITYSGLPVDRGIAAVDPSIIPLGSLIWIEGYGYAIAADTGGLIKGLRVDVFFHDLAQAVAWGKQQVRVKVMN